MPDIFNSILNGTTGLGTFLICIISSVIFGILISIVYILTHRKESYSQSYVMSIIMLPGIVSLIILLINDTSPKDIAYIFFSMAVGVSCGLGYIAFAVIFIIILSAFILVLNTIKYGAPKTSSMTLKITVPENLNYQGLFDNVLNANTVSWRLKRVKTVDFGTLFDLVYSIELKNDVDQKKFIDSIRTLNGNLNVTLILYKYDDQIYAK